MLVLIVEDDALLLTTTADILRDAGHEVIEASDGSDALQQVENTAVDLLLTDIRMPGIDGWALAERFRERRPDLPVVYATGFAEARRPVCGSVTLTKPYREAELLHQVEVLTGTSSSRRRQCGPS